MREDRARAEAERKKKAPGVGALPPVVLDTHIFVAAGFQRRGASARLVEPGREPRLRRVWNDGTRREIETIVRKIPPLSSKVLEGIFREVDCWTEETQPERFNVVPDPADCKFAALGEASGAALVTMDEHLLQARRRIRVPVLTPGEL